MTELTPEQEEAYAVRAELAPTIQSNIVALVEAGVIDFDTSKYYAGGLGTGRQSNIVIDTADATKLWNTKFNRLFGIYEDADWLEYLERTDGVPYEYYTLSKSFKMTVAPRFQVQFRIWQPLPAGVNYNGEIAKSAIAANPNIDFDEQFKENTFVLVAEGTGFDGRENTYDEAEKYTGYFGNLRTSPQQWQQYPVGGDLKGSYGDRGYERTVGADWVLDEGDYIEYNHEERRFTIVASGEIVTDNIAPNIENWPIQIGTISAANYDKTDEQIYEQGLLDDPLTPEDETKEPQNDSAFSDRVARIKRELKFRNRGGRRMLGGLALLGIAIGLLYFFTKSKIIQNVKPSFESGIEGGIGVE